jgi:hypothetical protein
MDTNKHTLFTLFQQLGLAADDASMEQFVRQHSPLGVWASPSFYEKA